MRPIAYVQDCVSTDGNRCIAEPQYEDQLPEQIGVQLSPDAGLQVLGNLSKSVRSGHDLSGNFTSNFILTSHPEDALTEISTNQLFKRLVRPHQELASLTSVRLHRDQLLLDPEKRNLVLFDANYPSQFIVA